MCFFDSASGCCPEARRAIRKMDKGIKNANEERGAPGHIIEEEKEDRQMAGKLNALFIFLAPGADSARDRGKVDTPGVALNVVGVVDYEDAAKVAAEYVEELGVTAVELCGGFGNEGTAIVSKAVKGKAAVGTVKFDFHPGLDFKSGDDVFM